MTKRTSVTWDSIELQAELEVFCHIVYLHCFCCNRILFGIIIDVYTKNVIIPKSYIDDQTGVLIEVNQVVIQSGQTLADDGTGTASLTCGIRNVSKSSGGYLAVAVPVTYENVIADSQEFGSAARIQIETDRTKRRVIGQTLPSLESRLRGFRKRERLCAEHGLVRIVS